MNLNLAYRWLRRLGLQGAVPDHSTFSKNRRGRFRESEALRLVFDSVAHCVMAEGLVKDVIGHPSIPTPFSGAGDD